MNTDADVRAIGPMLPAFRVEQIRLGFEEAGFSERQFDLPGIAVLLYRRAAPGRRLVRSKARQPLRPLPSWSVKRIRSPTKRTRRSPVAGSMMGTGCGIFRFRWCDG